MSDTSTYRLRSYSMIASIWSLVSTAPKCGMRPDEMPRVPYESNAGHAGGDPAEQVVVVERRRELLVDVTVR